jgi:hypothetical protein
VILGGSSSGTWKCKGFGWKGSFALYASGRLELGGESEVGGNKGYKKAQKIEIATFAGFIPNNTH